MIATSHEMTDTRPTGEYEVYVLGSSSTTFTIRSYARAVAEAVVEPVLNEPHYRTLENKRKHKRNLRNKK